MSNQSEVIGFRESENLPIVNRRSLPIPWDSYDYIMPKNLEDVHEVTPTLEKLGPLKRANSSTNQRQTLPRPAVCKERSIFHEKLKHYLKKTTLAPRPKVEKG